MPARETILALPFPAERVPRATAIRSTTLISSLGTLRALGLAEAYFAQLPSGHHAAIRDRGKQQNLRRAEPPGIEPGGESGSRHAG